MTDIRDAVETRMREVIAESLEGLHADAAIVSLIHAYLERPAGMVRARLLAESSQSYGALFSRAGLSRETPDACEAAVNLPQPITDLAAATELLHLFALMHDDCIDDDDGERAGRRGRQAGAAGDGALAILAGDLVHAIGSALFSRTVRRYRLDRRILDEVHTVSVRTILGQVEDLRYLGFPQGPSSPEASSLDRSSSRTQKPSFERLYRLYDAKTGWYTVAAPLRIGALTAGVPDGELDRLAAVALPLGRAYQLRDDLEDLLELLSSPGSSGAAPRWELNLAATWHAASAARGGSMAAPATCIDPDALTIEVTRRIAELCVSAAQATSALNPRSGSPEALVTRLRETLRL